MQIFKLKYVHFTSPVKSHSVLQNSDIKMEGNKDKIQTDSEDVALFTHTHTEFSKGEAPLLHGAGNGTWNHTSALVFLR